MALAEKNQVWIGSSGLRLTVTKVTKNTVTFEVERRQVNRKTGEVEVTVNERRCSHRDFEVAVADYKLEDPS